VVVADPETADVVPLTDHSVSILGKKIGATRVSLYGEGKRLVGLVDVEVSYDIVRLGAEIARQFPHAKIKVSSLNGRLLLSGSAPFGSILASVLKGSTNVDALIQALEQRHVARSLAEPNLVALSGDTANFLAGGEFPFPVSASLGTVTIEWKRFGVGLAFT